MRHVLLSKLISSRAAPRTSPGRAQVSAMNLRAAAIVGEPVYPSIARHQLAQFLLVRDRCPVCHLWGSRSAPRKANVGPTEARRVTTASLNTLPIAPRRRRAERSAPTALAHAQKKIQDFGWRDVGDRPDGERRGEFFQEPPCLD